MRNIRSQITRLTNRNFIYVLGIVIIATFTLSLYQPQNREAGVVTATSTQYVAINNEDAVALAKISPNCAEYYSNYANEDDPMDNELSDFTNLHSLSDFLCGEYSLTQPKIKLADGKTLHFVVPIFLHNCGGSGHCSYYPLLEEKPGLVRHIRGFTAYDDSGVVSQDTEGTILAWEISYNLFQNTLLVDDTHLGGCGIQNIYKFNTQDEPVLILATKYDCSTNATTTLFKL